MESLGSKLGSDRRNCERMCLDRTGADKFFSDIAVIHNTLMQYMDKQMFCNAFLSHDTSASFPIHIDRIRHLHANCMGRNAGGSMTVYARANVSHPWSPPRRCTISAKRISASSSRAAGFVSCICFCPSISVRVSQRLVLLSLIPARLNSR